MSVIVLAFVLFLLFTTLTKDPNPHRMGGGGCVVNTAPKTPRPAPPKGLQARRKMMARAEVFRLIDESLGCLYSEDEIVAWWMSPIAALDGETPRHFIHRPDGPEQLLEHLKELGQ